MKRSIWIVLFALLTLIAPLAVHAQDAAAWTRTYVVQPGDTLFRIAVRHGVSVNALATANGLFNPNLIYSGQVLRVPQAGTTPTTSGPLPGQPFDVRATAATNVYETPSFQAAVRYVLPAGTASAAGRSQDSAWIYVRSAYGVQGWVWAAALVADRPLLNALPVMGAVTPPPVNNVYTVTLPGTTNVYLIPSASAPLRAIITPGTAIANGRSQDGQWISINAYNGIEGWVTLTSVRIDLSQLNALPVTYRAPQAPPPASPALQASIIRQGIPLRTAPGGQTPIVRTVAEQTTVTVLGRSWDSTWLRVRMPDRSEGWVWLGDTNLSASQILPLPSLN